MTSSSKKNELALFLDTKNPSILAIVETHVKDDTPSKILPDKYTWISKNRPGSKSKGGIGCFVLHDNVNIINDDLLKSRTDAFERMWIEVNIECCNRVALCIVYLPVDGTDKPRIDALFSEVMDNISTLQNDGYTILIVGDFNAKILQLNNLGTAPVYIEKPSYNGTHLMSVLEIYNLSLVNVMTQCEGFITWQKGGSCSTIDYILISQHLEDIIDKVVIDEDGSYGVESDHSLFHVRLKTSHTSAKITEKRRSISNTKMKQWHISNNTDWNTFRHALEDTFSTWDPQNCKTSDEAWHSWKGIVEDVALKVLNRKKVSTMKPKYFWSKKLDSLRKERIQMNKIRRYYNRTINKSKTVTSILDSAYKRCKEKVTTEIKRSKVEHNLKMFKHADKSPASKKFWNFVREDNEGKNKGINFIKKDDGCIVTGTNDIANELSHHFTLKNTNASKKFRKQAKSNINKTKDETGDCRLGPFIISESKIRDVIKDLETGKATGIDNIPNEFLKYGGDPIVKSLQRMFQTFIDSEMFPTEWKQGIIKLIPKSNSGNELNNYRGITLTSNVYKVFAKLLEREIMKFLEENEILGEYQGAFRKDRRVEDQIFNLMSLHAINSANKRKTYVAFLDISKCFDSIYRDGLFSELSSLGINGKVWRLLRSLYSNTENKVVISAGSQHDGFIETLWNEQTDSLKQGCPLSPTLFLVVIRDLINMFKIESLCSVDNAMVPLLFADDIALIADSEDKLQRMLDVANKFAQKWGLNYNEKKSKVLIFGKRIDTDKKWKLGPLSITECNEYKYLGIYVNRNMNINFHIESHLKQSSNRKIGAMKHTLSRNANINRVNFGNTIWHHIIKPTIIYAAAVWGNLSKTSMETLKSIQYKCGKAIMNCHLNVNRNTLLEELGWEDIEDMIEMSRIKYFERLCKMCDLRLTKQLFHKMMETFRANPNRIRWSFCREVLDTLEDCGLDFLFTSNCKGKIFDTYLRFKIMKKMYSHEQISETGSRQLYTNFDCSNCSTPRAYLTDPYTFRQCQILFKARTCTLGLGCDLVRMNLSDSDVCQMCDKGAREDLQHFLFICPFYKDLRRCFLNSLYMLCMKENALLQFNDFMCLQDYFKTIVLLDLDIKSNNLSKGIMKIFKKYLTEMFKMRFNNAIDK